MSSLSVTSKPAPRATARPFVSVIVPIRNEEPHIKSTLQQLLAQQQDGLDVEILVADGQSTDRTREIVGQLAKTQSQIKLFNNPGRLSSSARNIGIEHARGDYLVIIDGHCEIPTKTYFLDMVEAFDRTGADCLGRPQPLDVTDATPLQQAIAAARSSRLGHHPASYIYSKDELQVPAGSVAVAYRRDVFDRVGMFDPTFDACEDYELNRRVDQAGLTCFLIPKLTVKYKPRNSLRGLFKQLARYGRGRVRMARKHSESISVSSLIPALFLFGLVLGPFVCWLIPFLWPIYFGVIGLYALLVAVFTTTTAISHRRPLFLLLLPLIFVTVHLGSGWGVLREFLSQHKFD